MFSTIIYFAVFVQVKEPNTDCACWSRASRAVGRLLALALELEGVVLHRGGAAVDRKGKTLITFVTIARLSRCAAPFYFPRWSVKSAFPVCPKAPPRSPVERVWVATNQLVTLNLNPQILSHRLLSLKLQVESRARLSFFLQLRI